MSEEDVDIYVTSLHLLIVLSLLRNIYFINSLH